ncbi:MAG: VWA domain-containing protein [Candidatus Cloacimonetes bacterium]|nr:VWA domain-containing protein [Candidatus Cloacimonadota bacterium]
MYNFLYPHWFWALLIVPVVILYDLWSYKRFTPKIVFSNLSVIKLFQKRSSFLRFLPMAAKSAVIVFIVIALARPRFTLERREHTTFGIDIALVIDISGSMQAVDFRPNNRIEVAKDVVKNFVKNRPDDRFSVITFGTYAYSLVPLTNDFSALNMIISDIKADPEGQTAIGNGIAIGVSRLKDSPAKSRIIILLTDGVNNAGQIDPNSAAELAKTFGIKVYAIGIGSKGQVDFPYQHPIFGLQYRKVNIDMDINALHKIAEIGGTNRAAIASSTEQLQDIFAEIDRLEKTEIKSNVLYEHKELFIYFLYVALGLIFVMILSRTIFRFTLP